jgi:hypothetical protein
MQTRISWYPLVSLRTVHRLSAERNERAFAMPTVDGRADWRPQVEYAVVGASNTAATFAHELLHLFGADDFYLDGRFDAVGT